MIDREEDGKINGRGRDNDSKTTGPPLPMEGNGMLEPSKMRVIWDGKEKKLVKSI